MRDKKRHPHSSGRPGAGKGAGQAFGPRKGNRFGAGKPTSFNEEQRDRRRAGSRDGAATDERRDRGPRRFETGSQGRGDRDGPQSRHEFSKRGPRGDSRRHDRPRPEQEPDAKSAGGRGRFRRDGVRGKHRFEAPADDHPQPSIRSNYGRKSRALQNGRPDGERAGRPGALWIYGRHAALAALANENRKVKRILAADSTLEWLLEADIPAQRRAMIVRAAPFEVDQMLPAGAVHQGIAVEVEALPRARLRETCAPEGTLRPVVVFDQITDPHNIGAIFRSAAAFGARAVIVQDRRTPPLAGALAKAAAGAVETVPCIEVVNISRALEGLKDLGYFCAGLDSAATKSIVEIPQGKPVALVLGAEGEGLRRLVRETCDEVFRIPLDAAMESLNVSNAAAVALYELTRRDE